MASGERWTDAQFKILDAEYPTCWDVNALALKLDKTPAGVKIKASQRGIKRNKNICAALQREGRARNARNFQ